MNKETLTLNYLNKHLPETMIAIEHYYNNCLHGTVYVFDRVTNSYVGAVSINSDGLFSTNYDGFKYLGDTSKKELTSLLYHVAIGDVELVNYEEKIINKILSKLDILNEAVVEKNTQQKNVYKIICDDKTLATMTVRNENDFAIALNSYSTQIKYSNSFNRVYYKVFSYCLSKNSQKNC